MAIFSGRGLTVDTLDIQHCIQLSRPLTTASLSQVDHLLLWRLPVPGHNIFLPYSESMQHDEHGIGFPTSPFPLKCDLPDCKTGFLALVWRTFTVEYRYSGAGGGIRTHEGLRHRISPASRILSQAPFDPANGPAPLT